VTLAPPPLPQAPPAAPPNPAGQPLSPEHLRQLAAAQALGKKLARAVNVALFDGWAIATFATLTFLLGLGSVSGMLVGAAMGVIAYFELRGAKGLRRLDLQAARTLGYNQVALGSLLIAYALWSLVRELTGAGEYATLAASDPQLGDALKPIEALTRMLSVAVNLGLIVVSLIAQGSLAAYYFSRVRYIRTYVEQTPAWIVAIQKTGTLI
jgi:hypothetical protein